jgi:hypothetical protein
MTPTEPHRELLGQDTFFNIDSARKYESLCCHQPILQFCQLQTVCHSPTFCPLAFFRVAAENSAKNVSVFAENVFVFARRC